ncbi:MAG: hypothetical protein GYA38_09485 [Chloroflexi bacterium]|jgi:hypothetical protein|nr:hypothetical protein [Chloroflexota bacterium]
MLKYLKIPFSFIRRYGGIFLLFIPGVVVLIHIFGITLSRIPGDLGDSRMVWYMLEHFYAWISGKIDSYWNAGFFYPYPSTAAFSETMLGSAPLYALFRFLGFSKYLSYQFWLILGFMLNYFAAAFVLVKCSLKPLAAGAGAFFFAFGMPIFGQEYHLQLILRFLVPVAGYLLWRFSQKPRFVLLPLLFFAVVWQFYISVYTGFFLAIMLLVMLFIIPLVNEGDTSRNPFRFWSSALVLSFKSTSIPKRILHLFLMAACLFLLVKLFMPYYVVTQKYGFTRSIDYIITMMPRLESFFLADGSQIWNTKTWITKFISHRHEQQLFPGLSVYLLIAAGLIWNFRHVNKRFALVNLFTVVVILLLTTYNNGFSPYVYFLSLPGFNSIRTVCRIHLVSMWPVAVFIATVLDALLSAPVKKINFRWVSFLLIGFMLMESLYFDHPTYEKTQAAERLSVLYNQIEKKGLIVKEDSVLYVGEVPGDIPYATDVDGMWLGLELGIPTLNGMTSNFPDGAVVASSDCGRIDSFIRSYMKFASIKEAQFRDQLFKRLIILNMDHCNY